jgi:acylphosphatase
MSSIQLVIKGKVQGVFYRASAREVAEKLGITGWIKNTPEGFVQIAANGSDEQLQEFISWCKKGPSKAIVTEIIVNSVKEENQKGFKIIKDH